MAVIGAAVPLIVNRKGQVNTNSTLLKVMEGQTHILEVMVGEVKETTSTMVRTHKKSGASEVKIDSALADIGSSMVAISTALEHGKEKAKEIQQAIKENHKSIHEHISSSKTEMITKIEKIQCH